MHRFRSRTVLTLGGLLSFTLLAAAQQPACPDKQSSAELDARIDDLIGKMTVEERISQLQDRAVAIPRLGVPGYNWWNEGLHGLARDGHATVFPQAIGMAATWDASLLHDMGDVVATEARGKFQSHGAADTPRYGGLTVWSPNINIFRDPRWGRGQETYGEDPFLTTTLGLGFVGGVQGTDSFYRKADATPKHFAAHSGPEKGRDSFDAVVSPHDLADTYLSAFHALTTQGNAAAMMCSYNAINGTPSCANGRLLQDTVRGQWGFRGYVVSDCGAVGNISAYHHYSADAVHAAAASLNAGVDLECGRTYASLGKSFEQHLVTETQVNTALHRLLLARVQLGMRVGSIDASACTPYRNIGDADIDTPAHAALALRAAEESAVLLKNDGVLPLRSSQRIAVIGPTSDSIKVLEANYHGTASHPVTPLEGLRAAFPNIHYAQGSVLAAGVPVPISRDALRVSTGANAPMGLRAEYFNAAAFDGKPAVSEVVSRVDLDLDRVGPAPAITAKQYAARWQGALMPPAAGSYTLRVDMERCWDCTTHDSFQLFVDDNLVIDNHGAKNDKDRTTLTFADAKPHALRLELMHTGDDEGISLEWEPPASVLLDEAEKAAKASDVVVAFVGLSPDLEGEALQVTLDGFDGGDRTSLSLPALQSALLQRLSTLRKPMILVLTSGSAVALDPQAYKAAAMMALWYPGQAGGTAVANLLTGKTNPSGRLPVTFYRSATDLPAFSDYSMEHRTYRYFDGPVLFPFGYGLSYSRFTYSPTQLSKQTISPGEPVTATVTVRNGGSTDGAEVAELYLRPPAGSGQPRMSLKGTQKIFLKRGESRDLTFNLPAEVFSTVQSNGDHSPLAGSFGIWVGGTQPSTTGKSWIELQVKGN